MNSLWSSGKDFALQLLGAGVQSLVEELRSQKLLGEAKKKKQQDCQFHLAPPHPLSPPVNTSLFLYLWVCFFCIIFTS